MITTIHGRRQSGKTTNVKKLLIGEDVEKILIITSQPGEWEGYPYVAKDLLLDVTAEMASYTTLVIEECQAIYSVPYRRMINACINDPNITAIVTTQTSLAWLKN